MNKIKMLEFLLKKFENNEATMTLNDANELYNTFNIITEFKNGKFEFKEKL